MYTNAIERRTAPRRGERSDRLWGGILLDELRQAAIGYTEAALESTAPDVRRVFERLAYETARKHEQLTAILQQNRLLEPAFPAPAAEVQRAAATAAETARIGRQALGAGRAAAPTAPPPAPPALTAPMAGTPTYAPRTASYGSPYMSMQLPQQQQQPQRPPEFALPHALPFGGLPTGAYTPPQPQPQPQPQLQLQQPPQPLGGAAAETEAPAPSREPEPASSVATREEASPNAAEARRAEPTATPAPKRGGRRPKASPPPEAAAPEHERQTSMQG